LHELPVSVNEQLVEIDGDVASSLGAMLKGMEDEGANLSAFSPPELGGFWEPKAGGKRGEGILIWADENGEFHLAISRSKSQASSIIRNFNWMDADRRKSLLKKVSNWNCREYSNTNVLLVNGKPAELFYQASIWGKYKAVQRRSTN
jgi:hypothetical protein